MTTTRSLLQAGIYQNNDEDWKDHGACIGTNRALFFPERGESTKPAKTLCAACPVKAQCQAYAFRHNIKHGIWGGLSERQRRRIRTERATRQAARHVPAEVAS